MHDEPDGLTHSTCQEICWGRLPTDLRRRAIAQLQEHYAPEFFADVRAAASALGPDGAAVGLGEWMPWDWHFGQGMAVRNVLRGAIRDAELPDFPEWYGELADGTGNWDDYYIQCVEAAAGLREEVRTA